jgi:hypothetical protein
MFCSVLLVKDMDLTMMLGLTHMMEAIVVPTASFSNKHSLFA